MGEHAKNSVRAPQGQPRPENGNEQRAPTNENEQ
jgi:hypothetical protein